MKVVKTIIIMIVVSFSGLINAHNKVVVIPLFGDDPKPLARVFTVAKENGDFDNLNDALIAAMGQREKYRAIVVIAPGLYDNIDSTIFLPEYVDVIGSGVNSTVLRGSVSSNISGERSALIAGKNNSSIQGLTIENTGSDGQYTTGIFNLNSATLISDVNIKMAGSEFLRGITNFDRSNPTIRNVNISLKEGTQSTGILNWGGSSPIIDSVSIDIESVYYALGIDNNFDATPRIMDSIITMKGPATRQVGISTHTSTAEIKKYTFISNTVIDITGTATAFYPPATGLEVGSNSKVQMTGTTINIDVPGSEHEGIYIGLNNPVVKISNSQINTNSVALTGTPGSLGTERIYISNTLIDGTVEGSPACSFVFSASTGAALDENCKVPLI